MTFKKWKPFWSYDIEKTEKWLSKMAEKGYRLIQVNRITRMFLFENGEEEKVQYFISYDKNEQTLPSKLINVGWKNGISAGNWRMLENRASEIVLYPTRDGLVKRNRFHSLILTIISVYYGLQLFLPIMLLMTVLTSAGEVKVESSPYWSLTILYFLQVIGVIILTITMTRKLRAFERRYYDMESDEQAAVGKTFAKWKPNWMFAPDLIENWLEEMALKGNHLVKVQGPKFIFEEGQSRKRAFALDFQWKTSPSYIETHKSAGWQFIYATAQTFYKTTVWTKEYEINTEKPYLTYDLEERKAQKKKVIISQGGLIAFMFLIMGYLLYNMHNLSGEYYSSAFQYWSIVAVFLAMSIYFYYLVRMIGYMFRKVT